MRKKIAFRFDIDTHRCMRDGVPRLLEISVEMNVPFTFFLNAGRAVSVKETLLHAVNAGLTKYKEDSASRLAQAEMMSARKKLGNSDYIYAAVINPCISRYKDNLKSLYQSKCEVGLHGGKNHAIWQNHAMEWSRDTVREEIGWAISEVRKTLEGFKPEGFASPGWTKPDGLNEVLKDMGFCYSADFRNVGGIVFHQILRYYPSLA